MSINSIRKMLLEDSDSENELELLSAIVLARRYFKRNGGSSSRRGGSVPGRMFIDRDSLQGHQRLFLDYFADSPSKNISQEVSDASSSFLSYFV